MLKDLGKGLLARSLAYTVFGLGFWLLFQGFLRPNIPLGILGGVMIPVGMYLIVRARRSTNQPVDLSQDNDQKEEDSVDPIHDPIDGSH